MIELSFQALTDCDFFGIKNGNLDEAALISGAPSKRQW
jgi:hypothetical protein